MFPEFYGAVFKLPLPVRITLVRHGESTANQAGRWQGHGDSPLSELGERQARALGQRLRDVDFDRVVSSDLRRAADTAGAIGVPVELREEFREFHVGRWEGLTRDEVQERFPDDVELLRRGAEDVPLGGGESHRSFAVRVDHALSRLRSELSDGDHALVVCHGGVIATLLAGVLGIRNQQRWPFGRVSNTGVCELRFDRDGVAVAVFNDTLHLSALGAFPACEGLVGAIALVADDHPDCSFGVFADHYELARSSSQSPSLAGSSEHEHHGLRARVLQLAEAHGTQRICLSAAGHSIHAFAEQLVGLEGGPSARLSPPARGALCHIAVAGGMPQLFDYGVLPELR